MKKKIEKKKTLILIIIISILLFLSITLNIFYIFLNYNKIYKNDENIIFFGDSITEEYNLDKFYPKRNVINSGISGHKTEDLVERLNEDLYIYNPSEVFLLIGINDLNYGIDEEDIILNIQNIINGIKINRPHSKLYVESIYPINKNVMKEKDYSFAINFDNEKIKKINKKIKNICYENNVTYIDVYDKLTDKNGNLKKLYTKDGVHLNNLGYLKVTSILKKYIK